MRAAAGPSQQMKRRKRGRRQYGVLAEGTAVAAETGIADTVDIAARFLPAQRPVLLELPAPP